MLKTFARGLVFGAGFTLALLVISTAFGVMWAQWTIPDILLAESHNRDVGPHMDRPMPAEIRPKAENAGQATPNYSFFNEAAGHGDHIPDGGGILGLSLLPTEPGALRPRTFQVWLTQTELWKIRTDGMTVEVEKLPYPSLDPHGASVTVFKLLPSSRGSSSIGLSAASVEALKIGKECDDDDHLNGELRVTTEGVVFLMPDEIKK